MKVIEIKKLNSRHRQIMRAILAGKTRQYVIVQSGMSASQYERVTRSTIFISEMKKMQDEIRLETIRVIAAKEVDPVSQVLKEGALPAAQKMVGLLESKDENISQTSAKELLTMDGRTPKAGVAIDNRKLTFILQGKDAENLGRALEDSTGGSSINEGTSKQPEKNSPK
jgi:hypothetical protein